MTLRRRLSIITAAYGPLAAYFEETIKSVEAQVLPDGWDLEWLVQEDGKSPTLEGIVARVKCAKYAPNLAHTGIAATRNLALTRATGDVVQVLDHDDVLLPGALTALLPRFDTPAVHWVVGQADDLLPDGQRRSYESALPFGPIARGVVNNWAIKHNGNWPIHCAGLLLRTNLVRTVGGWGGVPVDDDIIMFSAVSELAAGYNDPSITWLYRIHDRQTHRSAAWRERSSDGRRIALQRIEAMRQAQLDVHGDLTQQAREVTTVGPAAKDTAAGGQAWWHSKP